MVLRHCVVSCITETWDAKFIMVNIWFCILNWIYFASPSNSSILPWSETTSRNCSAVKLIPLFPGSNCNQHQSSKALFIIPCHLSRNTHEYRRTAFLCRLKLLIAVCCRAPIPSFRLCPGIPFQEPRHKWRTLHSYMDTVASTGSASPSLLTSESSSSEARLD